MTTTMYNISQLSRIAKRPTHQVRAQLKKLGIGPAYNHTITTSGGKPRNYSAYDEKAAEAVRLWAKGIEEAKARVVVQKTLKATRKQLRETAVGTPAAAGHEQLLSIAQQLGSIIERLSAIDARLQLLESRQLAQMPSVFLDRNRVPVTALAEASLHSD